MVSSSSSRPVHDDPESKGGHRKPLLAHYTGAGVKMMRAAVHGGPTYRPWLVRTSASFTPGPRSFRLLAQSASRRPTNISIPWTVHSRGFTTESAAAPEATDVSTPGTAEDAKPEEKPAKPKRGPNLELIAAPKREYSFSLLFFFPPILPFRKICFVLDIIEEGFSLVVCIYIYHIFVMRFSLI